jgi:hypothetical protein
MCGNNHNGELPRYAGEVCDCGGILEATEMKGIESLDCNACGTNYGMIDTNEEAKQ